MRVTKISQAGLDVICHFESFMPTAYKCPAGVWTIGYGSTRYEDGRPVKKGDTITEARGRELLLLTLPRYEQAVDARTRDDVSQQQFDALVSLCYNVGEANLKTSSILRSVNNYEQRATEIARLFGMWNKAKVGGVFQTLAGLTRRRKSEAHLYSTGQVNFFE